MPPKSEKLTWAALEAVYRVREDLALGEAQLRRALDRSETADALVDAHAYLHAAAEACRTAAQTALHGATEAGREAFHG